MLERSAFEKQANRQVSAQGHGEVSRRHTVWPFLDLSHNAGPSPQRQQLGTQIILILRIGDAKLSEGIGD